MEVSFEMLGFRDGAREGVVSYENHRMTSVRLIRRGVASRSLALRDLARLRGLHGPPTSTGPVQGVASGTEFSWSGSATRLRLLIVPSPDGLGWFATEEWTPAVAWPPWR